MSANDVDETDYLWDRTGDPDPDVARLERSLGALRYRAPERPSRAGMGARGRRAVTLPALAAAAVLLALVPALDPARPPERPAWALTLVEADGALRESRLREGERVVTGALGRARLSVGGIGEVVLEPSTRVRLLDAGRRAHHLSLDLGTLHARIWAPPGAFVVDTPSAVAVDLGCVYTLAVDAGGGGRLRVESGWVAFEQHGRESFVPAGAVCLMRPRVGPGTPHYEDATAAFARALATLDTATEYTPRRAALAVVLAEARRRDALSLWHLLLRARADERGAVHDRMAELVPPPPGLTRAGVLAGDRRMLDAWWDALDLGSAGFWRQWKTRWREQG